jgi:predicted transcriptional regulator
MASRPGKVRRHPIGGGVRGWRKRQTHTLDTAAKALGLSRRMVAYYDKGEKPIPRTVALATKALEMGAE